MQRIVLYTKPHIVKILNSADISLLIMYIDRLAVVIVVTILHRYFTHIYKYYVVL